MMAEYAQKQQALEITDDAPKGLEVPPSAPLVTITGEDGQSVSYPQRTFKPEEPKGEATVTIAVFMTQRGVVGRYRKTLDGSFSSVSRPIFATKYSHFFLIVRSRLLGFGPRRHPSHAYFARMLIRNRARPGGVQEENIFFCLYAPLGGHPSHAYFSTHA